MQNSGLTISTEIKGLYLNKKDNDTVYTGNVIEIMQEWKKKEYWSINNIVKEWSTNQKWKLEDY